MDFVTSLILVFSKLKENVGKWLILIKKKENLHILRVLQILSVQEGQTMLCFCGFSQKEQSHLPECFMGLRSRPRVLLNASSVQSVQRLIWAPPCHERSKRDGCDLAERTAPAPLGEPTEPSFPRATSKKHRLQRENRFSSRAPGLCHLN